MGGENEEGFAQDYEEQLSSREENTGLGWIAQGFRDLAAEPEVGSSIPPTLHPKRASLGGLGQAAQQSQSVTKR